ncbi:MAG: hypothetical protein M3042_02990 [Actinomycetota bacterium]|nr:hypothetical protein [Actinomycetota bacterium]
MRMPAAVAMIVVGLILGFAVTASPSWLSIGLLGSMLVVAGLAALAIAVMGRVSGARRERWHAAGPCLIAAGGGLWLAVHPPYVRGLDLLSLGFILALTGAGLSCVAGYLVSPWRGRGALSSWLRPPAPFDDDPTTVFHRPPDGELPR